MGGPYAAEASHAASVVVAGRDFRLSLARHRHGIRIEVTDSRPERLPRPPAEAPGSLSPDAETGRGLLLVAACASAWGCESRETHTKTVWAEIHTASPTM